MKIIPNIDRLRATFSLAAIAAMMLLVAGFVAYTATAQPGPQWQVVNSTIPVNQDTRIDVRLVDAGGKPSSQAITVVSSRIDMGPEGMQTMTVPLRPVAASESGTVSFETKLPMAGRWALTFSATVSGDTQPLSGNVILVAGEKRSEAMQHKPFGARRIVSYRAPMGRPDTSPVPKKDAMGMDYVPVYSDEVGGTPGSVRISPEKIQRAGIRTDVVRRMPLVNSVRAVGTIAPDETRQAILTMKFSGFVETLFVSTTGAEVKAGQPLMRVWVEDKDILMKEVDYVAAARGWAGVNAVQAANNLRLFGIPDAAIAEMKRTGIPTRSILINAPLSGTVLEKPAVNGMHFASGDVLFKTADLSTVWVLAQVSERDLAGLHVGQTAKIAFRDDPTKSLEGQIAFISPQIDMATRTAQVRIVIPNPDGRIRANEYADITIAAPVSTGPVLAIPDTAIIDSGTRQVAFVAKPDGVFEARNLVIGARSGGYDEVRSGLSEGERIVISGNFLIDAESNLQTAIATLHQPANPQ
jgi:Cu(I)/Ag(I) efflux system membrane fusion protein